MSQPLLNRAPSRSTYVRPPGSSATATVRHEAAGASSRQDIYLLGVWMLIAVITPLVGFLGARGYAPLVGGAGLLCLPLARPRTVEIGGLILFGLLVEWAVISAFWSPWPLPHTTKDILRFTGLHLAQQVLFCGALIVTARTLAPKVAGKALAWLGAGLVVLALVLLFESFTDALLLKTAQTIGGQKPSAITHWALRAVAQGGYALAALFWPVAVGFAAGGRPRLAAAFGALCLADLVLLHIAAPALALAASAGVFALVYWGGRAAALACMALALLETLVTPWLMLGFSQDGLFKSLRPKLPPSWAERVDVWAFTSARMAEKPLFGWGLDASRTFKGHIPLHPHDAPLQLWFELGLPGALLGALIWGFVFWQLARAAGSPSPAERLFAAAGCATGMVCLVVGALSFGAWQEWWICLVALAFAVCVVLRRRLAGLSEQAS